MKLATRDISAFIANPTRSNGVLVYGPDRGLVRQRVDHIAAQIVGDLSDPFNKAELTNEQLLEDSAVLFDELAAMSFTGDRRLILIRDASDKLTTLVKEALPQLNEQNYLLLYTDELSPRSSLRGLFEKETSLAALPCYRDEGVGLEQLIRDTFRGYGLQVESGVLPYLVEHLGGDRLVILSELEKISLYCGEEETISLEEVQHIVGDSKEHGLDDMAFALASGNVEQLMQLLDKLFLEGTNAVVMLRTITRHMQRLLDIYDAMEEGISEDQAIKSLRPPIFFKHIPTIKSQLRCWNKKRIIQILHLLSKAEIEIKTHHEQSELLCHHYLMHMARTATKRMAA